MIPRSRDLDLSYPPQLGNPYHPVRRRGLAVGVYAASAVLGSLTGLVVAPRRLEA